MTITAASGVNVQELMDFFLEENICFPSNVILRDVTVAGIISTGCHVSQGFNDRACFYSLFVTEVNSATLRYCISYHIPPKY